MFLPIESKDLLKRILIEELEPEFIYLFGSYSKGTARINSDVDIAFYSNNLLSAYELFLASNKLSLKLKKDVDLINLKEIPTVFAAQIISSGEIIYCENEYERQTYCIKIFKEYAKLNEERKVILDTIREDGSIYGK